MYIAFVCVLVSGTAPLPSTTARSSFLAVHLLQSPWADRDPRREPEAPAPSWATRSLGRTMLRGKSRLNVEWLGYSPGLLLEHRPPPAGRTLRSPRR